MLTLRSIQSAPTRRWFDDGSNVRDVDAVRARRALALSPAAGSAAR
jgi:hypothetical protein